MVTIERILSLPVFDGAVLAVGLRGKDRPVRYVDIAEVPDIRFWVIPDVFFLTTAYALHGKDSAFMEFLSSLVQNGAAGLGVKLGRFWDKLPDEFYAYADENDFPVILLPSGLRYTHAIRSVMETILADERTSSSFGNVLDGYFEESLFGELSLGPLLGFENAGFSLDMPIQVALVASRDVKVELLVAALRSLRRGSSLLATVRTSSEMVLLMSHTDEVLEVLSNSLSLLSEKIRVAVGGVHRLRDFKKSYEEARWVLGLLGVLGFEGGVHVFEDMELFVPLLRNEGGGGLFRSARRLLGPLLEYDSLHNAELVNTLYTFVLCDRNQKETARALHLHRNTLRYRLAKIESLLPSGSLGGFPFLRLSLALLVHFSK